MANCKCEDKNTDYHLLNCCKQDPYLAKAREMIPKNRELPFRVFIDTEDKVVANGQGYNEALSLCFPIVADLLKRVDELEKEVSQQLRIIASFPVCSTCADNFYRYKKALEDIVVKTKKYSPARINDIFEIAQWALMGDKNGIRRCPQKL